MEALVERWKYCQQQMTNRNGWDWRCTAQGKQAVPGWRLIAAISRPESCHADAASFQEAFC
jgi:hypothetical protein